MPGEIVRVNGENRVMTADESKAFDGVMESVDTTMERVDGFVGKLRSRFRK